MAQDENQNKDNRPVRPPFESGQLIDNQTAVIPGKNTLELIIGHRFGLISNGMEDYFGLYAPSNIRTALNFSLENFLMIGIAGVKNRKLVDLYVKANIFQQTRSNSFPVTITYYGSFSIDGREKDFFGLDYNFSDRLAFFNQIIITRRISDIFSVQFAPSISHINAVESGYEHDKFAISFGGRAKFSSQGSVIFIYDIPLDIKGLREFEKLAFSPKSNLAFGVEFATGTHVFQIHLGTADNLSNQYNIMTNSNEWLKGDLMFGFTLTRFWNL